MFAFLFRGNETIFGWDIANSIFDLEKSRSRWRRISTKNLSGNIQVRANNRAQNERNPKSCSKVIAWTRICGRRRRTNLYKNIKSPPVYQGDLITISSHDHDQNNMQQLCIVETRDKLYVSYWNLEDDWYFFFSKQKWSTMHVSTWSSYTLYQGTKSQGLIYPIARSPGQVNLGNGFWENLQTESVLKIAIFELQASKNFLDISSPGWNLL